MCISPDTLGKVLLFPRQEEPVAHGPVCLSCCTQPQQHTASPGGKPEGT